MLTGAQGLRAPKTTQPDSDEDPYTLLVLAIVQRAVEAASGHVMYPGSRPPDRLEAEARAWLEGADLAALLELCGLDAEPVVRRVRRLLRREEDA